MHFRRKRYLLARSRGPRLDAPAWPELVLPALRLELLIDDAGRRAVTEHQGERLVRINEAARPQQFASRQERRRRIAGHLHQAVSRRGRPRHRSRAAPTAAAESVLFDVHHRRWHRAAAGPTAAAAAHRRVTGQRHFSAA